MGVIESQCLDYKQGTYGGHGQRSLRIPRGHLVVREHLGRRNLIRSCFFRSSHQRCVCCLPSVAGFSSIRSFVRRGAIRSGDLAQAENCDRVYPLARMVFWASFKNSCAARLQRRPLARLISSMRECRLVEEDLAVSSRRKKPEDADLDWRRPRCRRWSALDSLRLFSPGARD
jgi:hypothetical protein